MARTKRGGKIAQKKNQTLKQDADPNQEGEAAEGENVTKSEPVEDTTTVGFEEPKKVIIPGINDDEEEDVTVKPYPESQPQPESNGNKSEDQKLKEQKNLRSLFVKNLPRGVTEEEIKGLSSDILSINLPVITRKFRPNEIKKFPRGYAYLLFDDEDTAEKNHDLLQNAKLGEKELVVDYVGKKSSNPLATLNRKRRFLGDPDPCRLYITGIPESELNETVLKESLFPTCSRIDIPVKKGETTPIGFVFVSYETHAETKAVHDEMVGKKVNGVDIVCEFARQKRRRFHRRPFHRFPKKARTVGGGESADADGNDDDADGEDENLEQEAGEPETVKTEES